MSFNTYLLLFVLQFSASAAVPSRPYIAGSLSLNPDPLNKRQNSGYEPFRSWCGAGPDCASSCGANYIQCGSNDRDLHCFNPSNQESCCSDGKGNSCLGGYYCTKDTKENTWCCPEGMDVESCAAAYHLPDALESEPATPDPTTKPNATYRHTTLHTSPSSRAYTLPGSIYALPSKPHHRKPSYTHSIYSNHTSSGYASPSISTYTPSSTYQYTTSPELTYSSSAYSSESTSSTSNSQYYQPPVYTSSGKYVYTTPTSVYKLPSSYYNTSTIESCKPSKSYHTYDTTTSSSTYTSKPSYSRHSYSKPSKSYLTYTTSTPSSYSTSETSISYPEYTPSTSYSTYSSPTPYPIYNTSSTTYLSYISSISYPTYTPSISFPPYTTPTSYPTYTSSTPYPTYNTTTPTYPTYTSPQIYSTYSTSTYVQSCPGPACNFAKPSISYTYSTTTITPYYPGVSTYGGAPGTGSGSYNLTRTTSAGFAQVTGGAARNGPNGVGLRIRVLFVLFLVVGLIL